MTNIKEHEPTIPQQCADQIRDFGVCEHGPAYPTRDELTIEQSQAIRRCFGRMPFGVNACTKLAGHWGEPLTLEQLTSALDVLADDLGRHAESAARIERGARMLQEQRDAIRSFLGIDELAEQIAGA